MKLFPKGSAVAAVLDNPRFALFDEVDKLLGSLTCDTSPEEAERIAKRLDEIGFDREAGWVRRDNARGACTD